LQQEAFIIVKISVALLSTSLVLTRVDLDQRPDELALMRDFYRHIGERLRWALRVYPGGPAMVDNVPPPPPLATSATTPLPILVVFEELQVIECWLDELRALLLQRAEKQT
jgi:hypothetical protein